MDGKAAPPAWHSLRGPQRVAAECRALAKEIARGRLPQLSCFGPLGDEANVWRLELRQGGLLGS